MMRGAAALLALVVAACAGAERAAVPVDPTAEARVADPVPPPHSGPPRPPPTPSLVALPGGARVPPPQPGGAGAPARGVIPRPPDLPALPASVDGCTVQAGAVTLRLDIRPPPVVSGQSRASLASLPVTGGHPASAPVGVYQASLDARISVTIAESYAGCLVPNVGIEARAPRQILLAAELTPGSCRYIEALAHEREHARIDDVLFRDIDAWLAAPVRQAMAEPGALRGTPAGLRARLGEAFGRAFERFGAARRQAQLSIDTAEEYARVGRACP
jgi:hypothetical protein